MFIIEKRTGVVYQQWVQWKSAIDKTQAIAFAKELNEKTRCETRVICVEWDSKRGW